MRRLNNKPLLILLIASMTVALLLGGCKNQDKPSDTDPTQTNTSTPTEVPAETTLPAEQTEPTGEEIPGGEFIPEETEGIHVESDYFTFYYPAEWDGKVEMIKTEVGGNEMTTFRTTIDGREVELFSIVVGPEKADGYLLGYLESDGGTPINVYSVIEDQAEEGWTKEQYDEICALQERINEITIQFQEDPRFIANRPY